jgi:transcription antitermination factor NusB
MRSHSRTYARIFALRILYQAELSAATPLEVLEAGEFDLGQDRLKECLYECTLRADCEQYAFFDLFGRGPNEYTATLVRGVTEQQAELDVVIHEASRHWAMFRMPPVDRAILRIATWELLFADDIPDSVAINEAVAIAKDYGGQDSPKFINGVLGHIAAACVA